MKKYKGLLVVAIAQMALAWGAARWAMYLFKMMIIDGAQLWLICLLALALFIMFILLVMSYNTLVLYQNIRKK